MTPETTGKLIAAGITAWLINYMGMSFEGIFPFILAGVILWMIIGIAGQAGEMKEGRKQNV